MSERERERERVRERQTDRETDRQRDRESERARARADLRGIPALDTYDNDLHAALNYLRPSSSVSSCGDRPLSSLE